MVNAFWSNTDLFQDQNSEKFSQELSSKSHLNWSSALDRKLDCSLIKATQHYISVQGQKKILCKCWPSLDVFFVVMKWEMEMYLTGNQ